MKNKNILQIVLQVVLGVVIVILSYLLYDSLMQPIRFNSDVKYRKEFVIQRLKDIRDLEIAYKDVYGSFTGSFDTLILFYKQDSLKIIKQVGSWDDSIAVANKQVYTDTLRIAVKDSLFRQVKGFNIDSIRFVPFVGEQFHLESVMYQSISNVAIPLFEAAVHNDVFLKGLDRQSVVNLNDEDKNMNKYPGLKVGSVTQPNNNTGNWE
ncbi:MAG: hypothetical protein LBR10_11760 [Prevotellaceae bacterium]|jgi:hypothetical protein|nr:hypothetical protein [Prevotellaceae bacterium]